MCSFNNVTTQIVTKIKIWQKFNCDQTQKLKLWPNSTNLIVTKLKKLKLWQNFIYDKSHIMTKDTLKGYFRKNILTPWQPMRCSLCSFSWFSRCFPFLISPTSDAVPPWPTAGTIRWEATKQSPQQKLVREFIYYLARDPEKYGGSNCFITLFFKVQF